MNSEGWQRGSANASPLLRALKPRQSNPNESDSICASRRRSVSGAPLTIFGVANFGRPQHQHDTFDLAKLPSGSVIETAAAPQIKKTPSLAVESESSPRSTDNSAERECTEAQRREDSARCTEEACFGGNPREARPRGRKAVRRTRRYDPTTGRFAERSR